MRSFLQWLMLLVAGVALIAVGSVVAKAMGWESREAAVAVGFLLVMPVALGVEINAWRRRRDAKRWIGPPTP